MSTGILWFKSFIVERKGVREKRQRDTETQRQRDRERRLEK